MNRQLIVGPCVSIWIYTTTQEYPKYSLLNESLARDLRNHMPVSVTFHQTMVECDTNNQSKVATFLDTYLRLSYLLLSAHRPLWLRSVMCAWFLEGRIKFEVFQNPSTVDHKSLLCSLFSIMCEVRIQLFICNWLHEQKYISLMTSSLLLIFIFLYCNFSSLFPCSQIFSGLFDIC